MRLNDSKKRILAEIVTLIQDSDYICFRDYVNIPRQIHMNPDMQTLMSLLKELENEQFISIDTPSNYFIHSPEALKQYRNRILVPKGIHIIHLDVEDQSHFIDFYTANTRIQVYDSLRDYVGRGFKTIEEAQLDVQKQNTSNTEQSAQVLKEIKEQTKPSKLRSWITLGISLIVPIISLLTFCRNCTQEKTPRNTQVKQESFPSNSDSIIITDHLSIEEPTLGAPNDSIQQE